MRGARTPDHAPVATAPREELGPLAARGGLWVVSAQAVRLLAQFATLLILVRWVTPEDFGRLAMALVCTGAVSLLGQQGLGWATVQRERLASAEVSTLFWVQLGVGVGLGGLLAAAAPGIARFFEEPGLRGVVTWLAWGFPLQALGLQPLALLRRRMAFARVAAVECGAALLGFGTAVAGAVAGHGVWALVAGQLASALATAVGAWSVCDWRPGRPVWNARIRGLLGFGAHHTGFGVWNFLARNLDDLLIGRFYGAAALGFYGRAYALLLLPLSQLVAPLSQVAIPTLARLRHDPSRFRRAYLRAVQTIAYLCMPACALVAVLAEDVAALAFGEGWETTGSLLQLLALAGFWQPVGATSSWLHLAQGRADRLWGWSLRGGSVLMIAILVGLPFGPWGVAACYATAVWCLVLPNLAYAVRDTEIEVADVLRSVSCPVVLAAVAAMTAVIVRGWLPFSSHFAVAAATSASALTAALALLWIWPAGRRDAATLWSETRSLVGAPASPGAGS